MSLLLNTGSISTTCDRISGHCSCRPGVGGNLCDRCLPGYFGMPLIAKGNSGCTRKKNLYTHNLRLNLSIQYYNYIERNVYRILP